MLSYARGASAGLSERSIHAALRETAARFPEREAVVSVHQNRRLSYLELLEQTELTARGLAGLGLRRGDRVGVWATNCVEWILLQMGAARAGVVLVNINPAYRIHELAGVLERSGVRHLFLHERDGRTDYRAILEGTGSAVQPVWIGGWDSFLAGGRDPGPETSLCTDVANIQYTSGTTGTPKGVLLTHSNLVNNGRFIGRTLQVTESDRICAPVPLFHCFGCVIGVMVAITHGAALVLPSERFHALPTMEAVEKERCTLLYGVPTMFIGQLNHPEFGRFDYSSLRGGIMAGAPCPVEIMKRVMGEMHCPEITIVYGQTESSPVITGSRVDDPVEVRVSTVGGPLAETEVRLAHRETGETVPVGCEGEVCTRGYLVMEGYDHDSEATRAVIDADGWLHTGDIGVMREDGYLHLTGRARDVIIRGGENVYPKEVENFLFTHPAVAEVEVVGVPDDRLGEAVCAWIHLREGASATPEEILAYCEGRIAHFKVPRYVRFVDDFPRTLSGKTQKYLIREREIELLGLESVAATVTA